MLALFACAVANIFGIYLLVFVVCCSQFRLIWNLIRILILRVIRPKKR